VIATVDGWLNLVGVLVTAVVSGGVLVYVKRLDKNNTAQHDTNLGRLERIETAVDNVADDVVEIKDRQLEHLQWHLEQEADKVVELQVRRQA